ncbi:hypothetical protein ACVW06_001851 [Pantoea ananatis]|nr:hypothetical protein BN1183_AH_00690 [Pantoea ananatis]
MKSTNNSTYCFKDMFGFDWDGCAIYAGIYTLFTLVIVSIDSTLHAHLLHLQW